MSVADACWRILHMGPDVLHFEMLCSPTVGWLPWWWVGTIVTLYLNGLLSLDERERETERAGREGGRREGRKKRERGRKIKTLSCLLHTTIWIIPVEILVDFIVKRLEGIKSYLVCFSYKIFLSPKHKSRLFKLNLIFKMGWLGALKIRGPKRSS